jgi:hypothetical protein
MSAVPCICRSCHRVLLYIKLINTALGTNLRILWIYYSVEREENQHMQLVAISMTLILYMEYLVISQRKGKSNRSLVCNCNSDVGRNIKVFLWPSLTLNFYLFKVCLPSSNIFEQFCVIETSSRGFLHAFFHSALGY